MSLLDTSGSILEGSFVRLRPLVASDASVTFRWRSSSRAKYLNQGAQTIAEQREWIQNRPKTELNFLISLVNETPVGMISLIDINFTHMHAEPARFLIGEEALVKGVPAAAETVLLLYKFAFDDLKLERLYGTIAQENTLMIKWQKFLGMREEGRLRRHYCINGKMQDAVCFGLLVSEYRENFFPRLNALISISSFPK